MEKTKKQLKDELYKLEQREAEEKREKDLEKNYQQFLNREPDLIIGKAHADIGITKIDYDWHSGRFFTIGDAISIHGNCGTSYNARAPITSSTHTYFHNVWTDKQRKQFQMALNKVAIKEALKIMSDLRCVLEIMGLQSESFFTSYIYPANKKTEIYTEIENERKIVLDKFKDKQFLELIKIQKSWQTKSEDGSMIPVPAFKNPDLSHSNMILFRYIFKNRPTLQKKFKECNYYKNWEEKILQTND